MNSRIISAIVAVVIIIIVWITWSRRSATETLKREFMSGFWCASAVDCAAKGYSDAYMYMGVPENDTNISRAYIVALKGGRGSINQPFDFDASTAWSGGPICGKMRIGDSEYDIAVDLDLAQGKMVWRDSFGVPLFTWEKNNRITAELG